MKQPHESERDWLDHRAAAGRRWQWVAACAAVFGVVFMLVIALWEPLRWLWPLFGGGDGP